MENTVSTQYPVGTIRERLDGCLQAIARFANRAEKGDALTALECLEVIKEEIIRAESCANVIKIEAESQN